MMAALWFLVALLTLTVGVFVGSQLIIVAGALAGVLAVLWRPV